MNILHAHDIRITNN